MLSAGPHTEGLDVTAMMMDTRVPSAGYSLHHQLSIQCELGRRSDSTGEKTTGISASNGKKANKMGQRVSRTDFEWVYDDQPHTRRRQEMVKKYPHIKKLFGPDPKFKYIVSAMVLTQIVMLYVMQNQSWPMIVLVAYCFGGVINHSLMLANHEISHNMAFGYARPLANRYFGMWCNLPIGVPMSVSFKKYHNLHHRHLADDDLDPDVPTLLEAKLFCTTFGKFIWVCLQPFFYGLRPLFVNPLPMTKLELINTAVQLTFNALVVLVFGWRMMAYLLIGSVLAMGLHPVAGHFIAEHYMFAKGFETYSYYGPLNWITFNVGYHNEHHDFPAIPGSRLPELKKIAPEYYETMPQHTSWVRVLYDFITDPAVGPYARIKRKSLDKPKVAAGDEKSIGLINESWQPEVEQRKR